MDASVTNWESGPIPASAEVMENRMIIWVCWAGGHWKLGPHL